MTGRTAADWTGVAASHGRTAVAFDGDDEPAVSSSTVADAHDALEGSVDCAVGMGVDGGDADGATGTGCRRDRSH